MRLRFAPSPTGQLHVGNARTALFNWMLARRHGGVFILRIEDTDAERSTPESEAAIVDDLRWLGLTWDEGPDVGGPVGPYRQSECLERYRHHAEALIARGDAYPCFCPPEQIEAEREAARASGGQPRYSGRCRSLTPSEASRRVAAGEPTAIRFKVPGDRTVTFSDVVRGEVTFDMGQFGDPVILRSDGRPAYNFAVVVDDGVMGITHVIRGEDHVSNTPRQLLLYEALGFAPPVFAHLSLVLGPDHAPLSKRHGATSVAEFRARGYLPEALVNYLALIGWSPGHDEELLPIDELISRFSLEDVGKRAGVFDPEKLDWVNRHYLKQATIARIAGLAAPFFVRAGHAGVLTEEGEGYLEALVPLAQASVDRLEQFPARVAFLFDFNPERALESHGVKEALESAGAPAVVEALADDLARHEPLETRELFREAAMRVRAATGVKGAALFHPIRAALTGAVEGPELDLAVPAIERGARLQASSGWRPVLSCRARAHAFARALTREGRS